LRWPGLRTAFCDFLEAVTGFGTPRRHRCGLR
jgi:hypothetical protein